MNIICFDPIKFTIFALRNNIIRTTMITTDSSFDIQVSESSSIDSVDFENIAFGQIFSDHLFVMDYEDGEWKRG